MKILHATLSETEFTFLSGAGLPRYNPPSIIPLALAPGTRVGPYEVIAQIGAGGMGEVYRARDTKLNRDVALKILPKAFTLDGARIGRFGRGGVANSRGIVVVLKWTEDLEQRLVSK